MYIKNVNEPWSLKPNWSPIDPLPHRPNFGGGGGLVFMVEQT